MSQASVQESRLEAHGLSVTASLKEFVDGEVLPDVGIDPDHFWSGFAELVEQFAPRNRELLEVRASMQKAITEWHLDHRGQPHDPHAYEMFLRDLGYLVAEEASGEVTVSIPDPEIAEVPGPQLVVPVDNARYAINAANARWGSLYDALYGTDAMGDSPEPGPYDPARGERVITWTRRFLDDNFPLGDGSHADAISYRVVAGALVVELDDDEETVLSDRDQFAGHFGEPAAPHGILLTNHGLRVELVIDRDHPVGKTDAAGVADVVLESAITTIIDFEDSIAAVDSEDKVFAYRNWLGLMRGELETEVTKGDRTFTRRMAEDRTYHTPDGGTATLPGRGLMLVRNVGLLMTTDAVLDSNGNEIPEGFLDAMVTVACALHDLSSVTSRSNSRKGLVYVVKPKLHGPDEAELTDWVFAHVEKVLGLEPNTIRVGVMDEERRTSANLGTCIQRVESRIAFINTGFLDRTGDEMHTSMEVGPMIRKGEMKTQLWILAYEDRNVDVGLALGLEGRAQIGKGMWTAPDRMSAMLEEKIGHLHAGATCAWVPSPTAATLHATHYHAVDVRARQRELMERETASLDDLLTIPVALTTDLSDEERIAELENNAQGILGYVVRWVDQGVGCSKVPDINGVALMEDRATCRISSQHIANWLHHGVITEEEVMDVMRRMAQVVDEQNAGDPNYRPMAPLYDGPTFEAAVDLVLKGRSQPSGYTEPILHAYRTERKQLDRGAPFLPPAGGVPA